MKYIGKAVATLGICATTVLVMHYGKANSAACCVASFVALIGLLAIWNSDPNEKGDAP